MFPWRQRWNHVTDMLFTYAAGLLLSFLHSLSLWVRCYRVFVSSVCLSDWWLTGWKQKNLVFALWRRTINEPELRVTMLRTSAAAAQVSLSEELHPKAAALAPCCHLWPLTSLSRGEGLFMSRTLIIGATARSVWSVSPDSCEVHVCRTVGHLWQRTAATPLAHVTG